MTDERQIAFIEVTTDAQGRPISSRFRSGRVVATDVTVLVDSRGQNYLVGPDGLSIQKVVPGEIKPTENNSGRRKPRAKAGQRGSRG